MLQILTLLLKTKTISDSFRFARFLELEEKKRIYKDRRYRNDYKS